jgi:hypothetical protein
MSSTLRPDGLRRPDELRRDGRLSASDPHSKRFSPSFENSASVGLIESEIEIDGSARAMSPVPHAPRATSEAWCEPGVHRV